MDRDVRVWISPDLVPSLEEAARSRGELRIAQTVRGLLRQKLAELGLYNLEEAEVL